MTFFFLAGPRQSGICQYEGRWVTVSVCGGGWGTRNQKQRSAPVLQFLAVRLFSQQTATNTHFLGHTCSPHRPPLSRTLTWGSGSG